MGAPSAVRSLWGTARGPFLLLTPACVMLGVAVAWTQRPAQVSAVAFWGHAALALLAGLCAHVSVNMLNEFVDARTGLDDRTVRTPFSGGSGTLQAHPELAMAALWGGVLTLVLAALMGLALLAWLPGVWMQMAPLGLLGLALVAGYSPWIARHPWLCLVAPGAGFGLVMVAGTACVLSGLHSVQAWGLSLVPFALVNNLLLLNQFPDVDADRSVGRRTLPVALGRAACTRVALAQWALAYAVIVGGVLLAGWPAGSLLGLLTLPLAAQAGGALRRAPDAPQAWAAALGRNVGVTLLTPVLVAVGWLI